MSEIYIGDKDTLAASALTTGDSVVVIDASAGDVRLVEWADFLALLALPSDITCDTLAAAGAVTCDTLTAADTVTALIGYFGQSVTGGTVIGTNALVNTPAAGSSSVGVLAVGSGTAPTTFPADCVQVWAADHAAGDCRLMIRTEAGSTPIKIGNGTITGLTASPSGATEATSKAYVDGVVGGGSALPVADTTAIVKGSADDTKLVRLEADGLTTATTRVLTVQDADYTLAGLNIDQTFSGTQTFDTILVSNAVFLNTITVVGSVSVTADVSAQTSSVNTSNCTNLSVASGITYPTDGSVLGAIGIGNGTPPSTFPADCVQVWAADHAAGDSRLMIRTEAGSTPIKIGNGTIRGLSSPGNSDEAATKGYVDTAVTGLLDFKGSTDCSSNPNYPSASKGDSYVVSVAGKVGGASGKSVDVGDVYLATADNAGGAEASVGTSWIVLEHNLTGALLSANNLSDLASASTARTNLGLGTAATQATGTSGATVPLCNGANTWASAQVFSGNATIGSGSAAGTLTAVSPGSGAGNGLSLVASAAASGNTAGGDVLLAPGAKSGSGSDGAVIIRQPGGTPGTSEGSIYHDGTYLVIRNKAGSSTTTRFYTSGATTYATVETGALLCYLGSSVKAGLRGNSTFILASDIPIVWSSTTDATGSADVSLTRSAAGVVGLQNASAGAGGLSSPAKTPAQIAADQNNYSPGVGWFQRWSSDASRNVTGMAAGADGETRHVWNVGAQNIVLVNESASSTAANRFTTATGADLTLSANKCALAMYDATSARWRVSLLP